MKQPINISWYENDARVYPAHFHAAGLMDILLERGIESDRFLKGTRLFYDDLLKGNTRLDSTQFCHIIENAKNLYALPELSFRWGHGMFPGHFDAYSQLICHANNLKQLTDVLSRYSILTPLLSLKIWEDADTVYIQWNDAIGLGASYAFVIEAYVTALTSLVNWYFSEKLPWKFSFSFSEPKHIEEYKVNLGDHVQFSMGVDLIMLDKSWLEKPFPPINRNLSSNAAFTLAKRQCENENEKGSLGFIEAISSVLNNESPNILSLNETADRFGVSPATFKRKLKNHGWSFQRLQDQSKLEVSLYLIQTKGLGNTELAEYLNITDANNFRKAFKRWCGMTPATIREKLVYG